MNTSIRRLSGGLAIAAVLVLGQGVSVRAADPTATPVPPPPSGLTGNEMLSVEPSVINVSAKPGSTTTTQVTVRAAAPLVVTIKSQGLGQSTDGNMSAVAPENDDSAYSARSMITATPQNLELKPGDKVTVDVTVTVPSDAGEGTRYAILSVTGLPPSPTGSANVGFGVELGVSAVVQIAETPQDKAGEIKGIDLGASLPGEALPVLVSFLNTGNTHFGAMPNELVATATLQDSSGKKVGESSASGNQISVLPGFIRAMNLAMEPSTDLVDGAQYRIEVGIGLKDGSIFDRKAMDFTWSGGGVLRPTAAPIETPSAATPGANGLDTGTVLLIVAITAAVMGALFLVLSRMRRPRKDGGAAGT